MALQETRHLPILERLPFGRLCVYLEGASFSGDLPMGHCLGVCTATTSLRDSHLAPRFKLAWTITTQ